MVYSKDADSWASANINAPGQTGEQAAVYQDKKGYRTSVWAMAWANVGLFGVGLLAALAGCKKARANPPVEEPVYPTGAPACANFACASLAGCPPGLSAICIPAGS